MKNMIPYYRVSTKKQEASGLGLEGQTAAVEAFAKASDAKIVKAYCETETGKRSDRPELAKALAHAKRAKATLVIAKLDRLARNVHFLSGLMESGVDFVACDNPHANRLTIHILAAVAEDEAHRISERTKAALAAYKARGGKLGSNTLTDERRAKGAKRAGVVSKNLADEAYVDIAPMMLELKNQGRTLREIAAILNQEGYTTRRDKPWNSVQVMRVLERVAN
jgi:DNA invertase Pin-like site-specific DNA recombinase